MTAHSFERFWECSTGGKRQSPFPYQLGLATEAWPDLLKVPTGLGKTASVVLAWIYKRLQDDPQTPRRLVYCLPMRTLVEQTAANTSDWLQNIREAGLAPRESLPPRPHILMGGETDDDWVRSPEKPAILIGVQDMLLSRALMRGYGVGRSRWPVDFALLHNDAMWVFDEVQLMAAGAPTSAQLEAFRRKIGTTSTCRSLWMSATLEKDWLRTVDLDCELTLRGLQAKDRAHPVVCKRLGAHKELVRSKTTLTSTALVNAGLSQYGQALADEILKGHRRGKTTLVVVNSVNRAQTVYNALKRHLAERDILLLLVHSRFRPAERRKLNERLAENPGDRSRIVVATQAVEAGVDVTSAIMFTELAPWPSLVQRFGRLNRGGEETDAKAFWIDVATDGPEKEAETIARPYIPEDLDSARGHLQQLSEVSPKTLESFGLELKGSWQVVRHKDLYQLFDTDPDLTGFDVDVSPYVRGADDTDVSVFWRAVADIKVGPEREEARRPHCDEICAVPIGRAKNWLQSPNNRGRAFVWDWVDKRWTRVDQLWPGALVLVDAALGGYDETRGFDASLTEPVRPITGGGNATVAPEAFDDDADTIKDRPILLPYHLRHVRDEAAQLCGTLFVPPTEAQSVVTSSLWHDVGKAHDVFKARCRLAPDDLPLAKTPNYNWRIKDVRDGVGGKKADRNRKYFRHELASALAWLRHGPRGKAHDLIAYLIAAHHGKVRMGLRALPDERGPDDPDARFARGVWDGDRLPDLSVDELTIPETELKLDVMEIGGGATGRSWATRTQELLSRYGPFRLAFLEALVRIADWRASEAEQGDGHVEDGGDDA